jgi:PRTRC genetic system protein C
MQKSNSSSDDAGWQPHLPPDHPLADLVNPAAYREWLLGKRIRELGKNEGKEATMARIFIYDGREFPDPDPAKTPEEVVKLMTDFFPELANSEVKERKRDNDTLYDLIRKTGTKG